MSLENQVVIVSSGQPSLNPRMEKEADALCEAGYDVKVIYLYRNKWATILDEQMLPGKSWISKRVGGSPEDEPLLYWSGRIAHKFWQLLYRLLGPGHGLAEKNISRGTAALKAEARKHRAGLYIAHNLAALPAAAAAARLWGTSYSFDAEDFHRNETSNDPDASDVILKSFLEEKYIPGARYLTASSPGIAAVYQQLFPRISMLTILNAFPSDPSIDLPGYLPKEPLKLFWFSQTIGAKRGLEDIISALKELPLRNIELHLLGDFPDREKHYLENSGSASISLFVYPPLALNKINSFAARFDVGLALEPAFCRNNDLALSNKIFTYLQAGLAVFCSDTTAQKGLLKQYPEIGSLYPKGDYHALAAILSAYDNDRAALLEMRKASWITGRKLLNWENEKMKLLKFLYTKIRMRP